MSNYAFLSTGNAENIRRYRETRDIELNTLLGAGDYIPALWLTLFSRSEVSLINRDDYAYVGFGCPVATAATRLRTRHSDLSRHLKNNPDLSKWAESLAAVLLDQPEPQIEVDVTEVVLMDTSIQKYLDRVAAFATSLDTPGQEAQKWSDLIDPQLLNHGWKKLDQRDARAISLLVGAGWEKDMPWEI